MRKIIVFAKAPKPGLVKTRLLSHLTKKQAASLARSFLRSVLQNLRSKELKGTFDQLFLACSPSVNHPFLQLMAKEFSCELVLQSEGNLGERMQKICQKMIQTEQDQLLLLGADAPTLPPRFIREAYRKMTGTPVVLGPSLDGGYYLLGITGGHILGENKNPWQIFQGVDWGGQRVFVQTLTNLKKTQTDFSLLPFWYDVDHFYDVQFLTLHLNQLRRQNGGKEYRENNEKLLKDLNYIDKLS